MAFAIASGLTPQAGIYCAIVTGFIISALGGSRVQIGGPTGAFVVVVSGIVAQVRRLGPVHVHDDGGRHARHPGRDRHRHRRPLHPAAGRHRLHQRHRGAHRQHADPRLPRPADGRESRRVRRPPRGDRQAPRHDHAGGGRPGGDDARARARDEPVREGVPGTVVGLVAGTARRLAGQLPVETIGIAVRRRPLRVCRSSTCRRSSRR